MATVLDLHTQAMRLADDADTARHHGDIDRARALYARAAGYDREAAEQLERIPEHEPTRCILYRNAGWLYFHAGDYPTSRAMANEGAAGFPPPREAANLQELIDALTEAIA